jgi:hypothetical protein
LVRQIATGTNTDVAGCSALPPALAVDGDQVAYSVEDARPGLAHATKIIVHAIASNQDVRTISSDQTVGEIDMSKGDLIYIDGTPSPDPYGWLDNTGLMLAPADGSDPTFVTIGPESASLSDGRIVWTNFPRAGFPQIWTNAVEAPAIRLVYRERDTFRGGRASGSGNLVTFATSAGMQIWDATTERTYSAAPSGTAGSSLTSAVNVVSSEGGWLVWAGYREVDGKIVQSLQGLPLDQVPLPAQ